MPAAFIDDGYTETARIAAVERLHPQVVFRFRPVTACEFGEYVGEMERADARDARRITAELLAHKLVDWDVRRVDGSPVAITAENVLALRHAVYLRLFEIVVGESAGDPPGSTKNDASPVEPRDAGADLKN